MALTTTDIANQALIRIGSERIMSLTDDKSKGAVTARVLYTQTLDELARAAEWNSLKKRAELARLTDAPLFGWAYQYQLPADFVDIAQFNGVRCWHVEVENWAIEGDKLLSNAEQAQVIYVALVENPANYDAMFTAAFVTLLAAKLAVAIRQDTGLAESLMSEYYRVTLPRARMKDANQGRKPAYDPTAHSSFIHSRFRSTRG